MFHLWSPGMWRSTEAWSSPWFQVWNLWSQPSLLGTRKLETLKGHVVACTGWRKIPSSAKFTFVGMKSPEGNSMRAMFFWKHGNVLGGAFELEIISCVNIFVIRKNINNPGLDHCQNAHPCSKTHPLHWKGHALLLIWENSGPWRERDGAWP